MEIVNDVYELTRKYPREEIFGLVLQSRRASVAMASNIAEGAGRRTKRDFSNFVDIALASSNELITQLLIAEKQKYITDTESDLLISKIGEWQNMSFAFQMKNLKE